MISRVSLGALLAVACVGAGGGVYLGKAAVSEINPAYFDEPESRFHGDLVPYRPAEIADYRAGDLSAANLDQAFGTNCIGCRAYPEEVVLVHRGTTGKAEIGIAEVTSEPVPAIAYEQEPTVEFASIERYTSYPVAQETEPEMPVQVETHQVDAEQLEEQ